MTAVTLTCRRLAGGIHRRRDEIEAWLSIGATQRQVLRDITRYAIVEAAVPGLDTTRTVGLVTLPGAVAGALRPPGLAARTAHISSLPSLPAANDVRTYSALGKRYMTTTTQCAITVVKHGNALFDLARWRRA
jgi:predicted Fe-S protein YdhL (DUF1289 family)